MREVLSVLADIATIITAFCATGILLKINVSIKDSGNKEANQNAFGKNNKQNIKQ